MIVPNVNEWYELMDIKYYGHLNHRYYIVWDDISDKEEKTLLETQMKVAKMMTESTNKNLNNENKEVTLNETAPSKSQTLYIITLYHTTKTKNKHA